MVQPLIPGGYILLSRKILNNEIMKKPPLYFKIWAWILLNAQHKDYGNLKRGQLFTSIPKMQEAMSYKVGYRTEKPTKKQIWGVLEWLRNPYEGNTKVTTNVPMIETTKVTHGIIITVVNYGLYQTSSNYEGNNEGNDEGTTKERRRERQGNNINKNDKNDKNDKKEEDKSFLPETFELNNYFETITKRIGVIASQLPELNELVKIYPYDWIKEAMEIAVEKNARTVRYISKILQNWTVEGKTEKKKQEETPNGWGHLKKFT